MSNASLLDIEALLGERPCSSIVLYLRRRRRPPAAARIDLPPGGAADIEETARALTGLVARVAGATSAEVVIYGSASDDRSSVARHAPLVRAIRSRLGAAGFEAPRASLVAGDHWAELADPAGASASASASTSAAAGLTWHRLPVESSDAASEPAARPGGPRDPHHGPFVPIVPAPERRRARAMAAFGVLTSEQAGVAPDGRSAGRQADAEGADRGRSADEAGDEVDISPDQVVEHLLRWNTALTARPGASPPTDARAVALAWSLRHRVVRDCVLLTCVWGLDAGVLALHEAHEPATATIGSGTVYDTVLGLGRRPPAPAALRAAVELLRRMVSIAPESMSAPPLTMLAWLEWARGRGTVATAYLEAAARADPAYQLARLMRVLITQGFVPEWVGDGLGSIPWRHR